MITINKSLGTKKPDLLAYFRHRADESLQEVQRTYATTDFKNQAKEINRAINDTKGNLMKALTQKAAKEKWNNNEILTCILAITYASYIVMIEYRNEVWPYEYMTFSRRIGELWEPFCKLCFDYPIRDLTPFIPPLFSEVKRKLTTEIEEYIDTLSITDPQKRDLKRYYNKVWSLVTIMDPIIRTLC